MADSEQYYQSLSDENKRIYFSQRYYTEKIAALESRVAALQGGGSGKAPAAAMVSSNDAALATAQATIAALTAQNAALQSNVATLDARLAELESKSAAADAGNDAATEETKQTARKPKAKKKDDAEGE